MKILQIMAAALLLCFLTGAVKAQNDKSTDDRIGANASQQSQSGTHGNDDDTLIYNQGVDAYNAKHYAEAADDLTKYLKNNRKNAQAHKLLASIYFQQNKAELAVPELETALQLSPGDTEARDNLGAAYLQIGSFDKAAALYKSAREQSPKDPQLALFEGLALTQAGKTDEAVAALQDAVKLDPKNGSAYLQLGVALEGGGKHADAAAAFQSAADLDPKDARAALYAGVLNHQIGHDTIAIPYLKRALALGTDNPFAAHMALGEAYHSAGNAVDAIAEYKMASQIKPDDFGAAANVGILSQTAGKSAEAEAAYRMALAGKALDAYTAAPVQSNLALLLMADGKLDEATSLLIQAAQGDAKNAHYQENLGLVYEKQGKDDLALAAFQKALEIDPTFVDAQQSVARLKK